MEAVIAAVHLDAGFEVAREVVLRLWNDHIQNVEKDAKDAKTSLQEWAQARGQPPPAYSVVKQEGAAHAPVFTVEVLLSTGESATASASLKRIAEQGAARVLLERLAGQES